MKRFFAFTLAETLVVIGIIGIVSALTLPNLNSSTGEKENVAKVKKIYSNLNDALGRATVTYGSFSTWYKNINDRSAQSTRFGERMIEFIRVSKNCGLSTGKGCFSNQIVTYISGAKVGVSFDNLSDVYKIITADGTSMYFDNTAIWVDIDGPNKGISRFGYDLFLFKVSNNYVEAYTTENFATCLSNLSPSNPSGGQCAATWVINYDNMDYLKLNSSGRCPNGTTPTEQNPRCK